MTGDYTPQIGTAQLERLEKLCNAVAVSGDEEEVRALVLAAVRPYAEVRVDSMGNVLAVHPGTGPDPRPRVMLAAHMDEVGFMIVSDEGDGLFKFEPVGGIDPRQLLGKPVWVGKDHTPGVIGARPIHLTSADERRRTVSIESMRIDIGPSGKARVGDRATFATRFQQLGPSLCAKALDNRLGVATLIELVQQAPSNVDLLAAFTVQEEVGLRGATTAAYSLNPDLAIAVDSTPAMDLPTWDDGENYQYNTRLDAGPAIYLADSSTLSDPRLVRHLSEVGDRRGIPYQYRQPGGGGTDAGAIHKARAGIPSLSVSVPGRYAHTAALIARRADWENTLRLLYWSLVDLKPLDQLG